LKAVEQESTEAMFELASVYEVGEETEPDYNKTFDLHQRSVDHGSTTPHTNSAICYENG
jgi:TPR repeat protein